MAVQAQYPSNVLILNRSEQERKEMEFPQPPTKFLDPSPTIFYGGGSGANTRKRGRDAAALLQQQQQMQQHVSSLISRQQQQQQQQQQVQVQVLQATTPALMSLAQLQNQLPAPMVSTGLCLDLDGRRLKTARSQSNLLLSSSSSASPSSSSIVSSLFSNELAAQMAQQHEEIERLLHAHGEELRRGLAEKRRRHCRAVVGAAARRLREREAEAERAAQRGAELEERLARLRAESTAWQAKALADQAEAATLHAQLQRASAAATAAAAAAEQRSSGGEYGGGGVAEDAESAHVDPDRAEPDRACRACRLRPASVVLLPCRHLCLCDACDLSAASCPLCLIGRTGSVHVCFS